MRGGKRVDALIEDLCALIAERVEVQKLVTRDGVDALAYFPLQLTHAQVRA